MKDPTNIATSGVKVAGIHTALKKLAVAFDPKQIKSADKNSWDFNPKTVNIFESQVEASFSRRIRYEHAAFCRYTQNGFLNEFAVPSFLKDKIEFIRSLAAATGKNLSLLLRAFAQRPVYEFFARVGWSLAALWDLLKKGFKLYETILSTVSEFVAKSPIGDWTDRRLTELDAFLERHPKLRNLGGPVVAGMLVYIWLNMAFTGNFIYDFDFSLVLLAMTGKYSLQKIFSGKDGHKMLLLFATGMFFGLSFPWPGPTSAKFLTAVAVGLLRLKGGHVS